MNSSSQQRRPVNLAVLDQLAAFVKLRVGVVLPDTRKRTVSLPRDSFVPVIQTDVRGSVSLTVFRYRMLVPIAHLTHNAAGDLGRITVASTADLYAIRHVLIRHFGGVTERAEPAPPWLHPFLVRARLHWPITAGRSSHRESRSFQAPRSHARPAKQGVWERPAKFSR
jgi:hypothetical protein